MRRRIFLILSFFSVLSLFITGVGADDFKFPLKTDSVRFAAIGDMGTGDKPQFEVSQMMLKTHETFPFENVIMLGDNIYDGSTPADYDQKFAVPYKALLDAGVKFWASLGNHDNPNQAFYKPFNMNGGTFYTFKRGNVRFFALNSNYMDPKQTTWLETQLKEAGNGGWKICFFHHPLYSSAKTHGSSVDLRKLLEPLFIKYGVDVVFSGHDHVYERVHPQSGIYYFVEGSSGKLRSGDLNRSAITDKGFDTDNSFMVVEVAGDDMYYQALSRTGVTVDSGMIHRTAKQ